MAIDYSGLRSLTARDLLAALNRDGFSLLGRAVLINDTSIPMAGG
jgi:hypothetical protein